VGAFGGLGMGTLLVAGLCAACGNPVATCEAPTAVVAYGRVEARCTIRGAAPSEPYDPEQANAALEIEGPGGLKETIPAFWAQDYTRNLGSDGHEHLTAVGAPGFWARFTPTRAGRWSWRFRLSTQGRDDATDWAPVDVTPSGDHGFIRRSAFDSRYLVHDDGAAYFAVGENLGWPDAQGSYDFDAWYAKLAAEHASFVRIWMPSWAFGIEWTDRDANGNIISKLGDYSTRLDRAWQLDYVLEAARRNGLGVMLSIQNHGAFSLTSNSEWSANPYNQANGGPLSAPGLFFSDRTSRELFERRLRYIVARWAYLPNLLAFELWNEVDSAANAVDDRVIAAWHAEMADAIRGYDPYGHLISTSLTTLGGASTLRDALFGLPQIDFTQLHLYGFQGSNPDFTRGLPAAIGELHASFGKPALAAEVGVDYRGADQTLLRDPRSSAIHDAVWAGILAGSFGTGMTWWWDNVVEQTDVYRCFGPVAALTASVAFDREGFLTQGATAITGTVTLEVLALRGDRTALAWIKNPRDLWWGPGDASPVARAQLTLSGMKAGSWLPRWIDPYSGAATLGAPVTVGADGVASVPVPVFQRDVGLRLERQ
jgi:hypothetical protein